MVTKSLPQTGNPRFGVALSEMDRWFDRFFNGDTVTAWNSPMALWEEGDRVYIEFEFPGVKKEDLEVVVQNGKLTIAGERKPAQGQRNYWHNERRYGRFERVFTLPETIDAESIKAELNGGLLLVTLAKRPEAQPKRIDVQVG